MTEWRVKGIRIGDIYDDYSFNIAQTRMGEKMWVPCMVWYLTDGQHNVLYDTGFGDPAKVSVTQPLADVKQETPFPVILKREACDPGQFDAVIISHLHWDHCGDLDLFTNAELFVQWSELQFELNPPSFFADKETPSWASKRFTLLDGDEALFPGLRVVATPGHTVGHQSLVVQTGGRRVGLSGDLFMLYDSFAGGPGHYLPPPCLDFMAWFSSAEKFARQCDEIVPSHDPRLTTKWIDEE